MMEVALFRLLLNRAGLTFWRIGSLVLPEEMKGIRVGVLEVEATCSRSLVLSHGVRSDTRNGIVTVTVNEKGTVSGTEIVTAVIAVTASVVSAARETVNANGIGTANESVVEETRKEHEAAADEKNANALVNTNENAAVVATLARLAIGTTPATSHPEKYYDGEAATVTAESGANETKEQRQTWLPTNMKAVYDLHRLWAYHLPRPLHPRLSPEVPRMSDDGAAVVASASASVSVTGTVRETVTMAAVAVVVVAIASADEAEMTGMVKEEEEVVEECGWGMRTRGLVGGCNHILIFLWCVI